MHHHLKAFCELYFWILASNPHNFLKSVISLNLLPLNDIMSFWKRNKSHC